MVLAVANIYPGIVRIGRRVGGEVRLNLVSAINVTSVAGLTKVRPLVGFEMRRGSQHFLRSVKLEGVSFRIESERGGRNSAQLVADPDEPAGRNDHRDDAASREIQHEVFHFAQLLILQVFHWRAYHLARLLNNAQVRPRFTGFAFTHDAVLAPCSVRVEGSYRLGGIFLWPDEQ